MQSQRCLLHCSVKVNARQLKTYSTRKCKISTLFSGHYLRNRSTLDIGVLGYIGIVQHKEHSPEVLSLPPGTPYIYTFILDKLQEYKRNMIYYVNRMLRDRLPRVMKEYSPAGRRNNGRPLKRLLDA